MKLVNLMSRKSYLTCCRRQNILPEHITKRFNCMNAFCYEAHPFLNDLENAERMFQNKLLKIEIKIVYWKLKNLRSWIATSKSNIESMFPPNITSNFLASQELKFNMSFKFAYERSQKKLSERVKIHREGKIGNNAWVKNYTNKNFSPEVLNVLSLGPKFSLPSDKKEIPYIHIIADVENSLNRMKEKTDIDEMRLDIVNVLTNRIKSDRERPWREKEIMLLQEETEKFFKNNSDDMSDVVIVQSDKGNVTTIIPKNIFEDTARRMLNDTNTYIRIVKDPTNNTEIKCNKWLETLHKVGDLLVDWDLWINEKEKLTSRHSIAPRIYFLPKVHKLERDEDIHNLKLRPIVSCVGSPTYKLAQHIGKIIHKSIEQGNYNIKNSYDLCEKLKNLSIPKNTKLVSLDVVSLFTAIPFELVTRAVKYFWRNISKNTKLDEDTFIELLKFLNNSSYFIYKGEYFKQIHGTPMGSPISPSIADLVMNFIFDMTIPKCMFNVYLATKYVDDCLFIVPNKKEECLLSLFNACNDDIQFTMEKEMNGRLPFLDMMLIRENNEVLTTFYMKPMASGRILNYNSHHPLKMRLNVVINLFKRMNALTTNNDNHKTLFTKLLKQNNFPRNIINRIINNNQVHLQSQINTTNAVTNIHIPLTYVQHMSEKIKKTLTRRVPEFKIAFKPTNRVKKFFTKLKDEIPKNDLTNVIYKIKCECGLCYIGQTIQSVKKRIGQHKNDVNSIKNLNRNCNDEFLEELKGKTALTEHVALTNHKFDFDNFEIVDHTRNRSQLNILEMLHIQNNSTVNRRTDTMKLSQIYNGVLKMRNKLPRKPRPVRRNERILR